MDEQHDDSSGRAAISSEVENSGSCSVMHLPQDVLQLIISHLDHSTRLAVLPRVCTTFWQACRTPGDDWRSVKLQVSATANFWSRIDHTGVK